MPTIPSTDRLVWAIVIHLVCDWLLQNHWMAVNKAKLFHPSGIVHAAIHAVGLMLVFPIPIALVIGVLHYIVDLRTALAWWRKVYRQTTEGEWALHVAVWGDQVLHILILAIAVLLIGG